HPASAALLAAAAVLHARAADLVVQGPQQRRGGMRRDVVGLAVDVQSCHRRTVSPIARYATACRLAPRHGSTQARGGSADCGSQGPGVPMSLRSDADVQIAGYARSDRLGRAVVMCARGLPYRWTPRLRAWPGPVIRAREQAVLGGRGRYRGS